MKNKDGVGVSQRAREEGPDKGGEEVLRARFYALLNQLLATPLDPDALNAFRAIEGDNTDMGHALAAFGERARAFEAGDASDEFTLLFYGHGAGGELSPYASFYLTGFVYEKPLADLRDDLGALGIKIVEGASEPEDHIAFLMEVMHGLVSGGLGGGADMATQQQFFEKHVAPWAPRFFEDLENAESADFYRPVGIIGRLLMEIEVQAFDMAA